MRSLKKAADLGLPEAQYDLGLHFNSQGEYKEAKKYLQLAADQGHKKALKELKSVENEKL